MSISFINKDLLESDCDYICHQVNCMGVMGSGLAKQIREKYPKVYKAYKEWHKIYQEENDYSMPSYQEMLGEILIVDCDKYKIINMAAQYNYGYNGARYTSYDAFWNCLWSIRLSIPKGSSIGFPYKIGCGLGGANWNVIRMMICEVLGDDFRILIYNIGEE